MVIAVSNTICSIASISLSVKFGSVFMRSWTQRKPKYSRKSPPSTLVCLTSNDFGCCSIVTRRTWRCSLTDCPHGT
jgi:hypothetical protein